MDLTQKVTTRKPPVDSPLMPDKCLAISFISFMEFVIGHDEDAIAAYSVVVDKIIK